MSQIVTHTETMRRFFDAMDVSDYLTAASLFADDAVYIGPPFNPGEVGFATGSARIESLDAIKAGWARRGKRTSSHTIDSELAGADAWFGEGIITLAGSEPRVFMAHATFDQDGKIVRFAAVR